jgi:hypothetical protein
MKGWPQPFLISWNIANDKAKVALPHPAVSLFNFHYATPPATVALNWELNKPIGDNETGFGGTNDAPYRAEAWDFILAGGALFNNLDYFHGRSRRRNFSVSGYTTRRWQRHFAEAVSNSARLYCSFDFLRMKPDDSIIKGCSCRRNRHALVPRSRESRDLLRQIPPNSKASPAFLTTPVLKIRPPEGRWRARLDTKTGRFPRGRDQRCWRSSLTLRPFARHRTAHRSAKFA